MSKSVSKEIYIRREAFLNSNPVKYQEKSKKCDKGRIFGCDESKTLFRLPVMLRPPQTILRQE
ncbi:hypothetical protein E2060_21050 [Escherichia coli]|nr:hypothetical protein [Escherichia coli]MHU82508.1 hypothetical protein [Escherichia coli]